MSTRLISSALPSMLLAATSMVRLRAQAESRLIRSAEPSYWRLLDNLSQGWSLSALPLVEPDDFIICPESYESAFSDNGAL
jgi:hypothetical protein